MKNLLPALAISFLFASCADQPSVKSENSKATTDSTRKDTTAHIASSSTSSKMADAATIMARKQVPILCYHHIKDIDVLPKNSLGYTVTVNQFKAQMKTLADSGFHSITPDQLYKYLVYGAALPSKPVMLTFDDT